MERITYVGAGFLALIAVIPTVVGYGLGVHDYRVTQFLGGTGLLIVVSVMLDFVQRIEAKLVMRNYQGFLATGGSGKGPRIRGARARPSRASGKGTAFADTKHRDLSRFGRAGSAVFDGVCPARERVLQLPVLLSGAGVCPLGGMRRWQYG